MSDVGDNETPIEVDEVEVKETEAPKGKMSVEQALQVRFSMKGEREAN